MSIDFGEDLSRSTPLEIIAKLMTNAQQQNLPIEDDLTPDYETVSPLENIHDVDVIAGDTDVEKDDTDDHIQELPYMFRTPESPYPYDLVHTTIGSGFTFPSTGKKHAARMSNDGSSYITIDHDSVNGRLDMGSQSFAVAFWVRTIVTGDFDQGIIQKAINTFSKGFSVFLDEGKVLVSLGDGSSINFITTTLLLNDGNIHSVIINIPNIGNIQIFVDNILIQSVNRIVGSINNTQQVLFQAGSLTGGPLDILDGDIYWFIWKRGEIFSSQQRDDYHNNGLIDLRSSPDTEVITIPGMENENPHPNASIGKCSFGV